MPVWKTEDCQIYGENRETFQAASSIFDAIGLFLKEVKQSEYVALNVYIPRNHTNIEILSHIREFILEKYKTATTLGFGPRYLHSTGQMHKGGLNAGLFLEITSDPLTDIKVPGESISFGTLLQAQALGDFQALSEKGRRIIRLHFGSKGLEKLSNWKG
jgi:transaldolase/glucose-6-phosphate isomerase